MASKIFMGNMPELMEKILNNLNNEFYSLYSCALVNRHWCEISIPILWHDPFSPYNESAMFITRYFASLKEDEQLGLKENGITVDFTNTQFDYAKFLKVLNLDRLCIKVYQLKSSILDDIVNLLLKIFIKSGATLSKLDLFFNAIEFKPEVIHLLEQNGRFLSHLKDVSISKVYDFMKSNPTENDTTLLRILAKNITKINSLYFRSIDSESQFYELIRIIKLQNRIVRFGFCGYNSSTNINDVISALESHKRSLKEIQLDNYAYSEKLEKLEELINSEQLEAISITRCKKEEGEMKILKALNSSICKVSTLEIESRHSANAPYVIQLLEKFGLILQRLSLKLPNEIYLQSSLFETLITFCPNIIYLKIHNVNLSTQFLKFINSLQKLQFLTLDWIDGRFSNESEYVIEKQVIQFAEILPSTLQYLDLTFVGRHVDILLDHCDVPLKKIIFGINDWRNEMKEIHALINFCKRKGTLDGVDITLRKFSCGNAGYLGNLFFSNELDKDWNRIKKYLERYVKLMPSECILVSLF